MTPLQALQHSVISHNAKMIKMNKSFQIRNNGRLIISDLPDLREEKQLELKLPHEVLDNEMEAYLSATANQQSQWDTTGITADEYEDSSLFSSHLENQYLQEMENNPYELNKTFVDYEPCFETYEEEFFHASDCLNLPTEDLSFQQEMLRTKRMNLFDPNNIVHYKLCEEWNQRNEKGLRKIYFSHIPKDKKLTVSETIGLFTRYHGRDSIIMRMTCLKWPMYLNDPTGIMTFKDCDRPSWLLDYIYTIMLSTIQTNKYFNKMTLLENPKLWNNHVRRVLLTTNLPLPLLHPVELETEEGNYFPITNLEFADWLESNDFGPH